MSRFLKLLITGTTGDLPGYSVPSGSSVHLAFGSNHMAALVNFVLYLLRYVNLENASFRLG
jgi:hypothetical protein